MDDCWWMSEFACHQNKIFSTIVFHQGVECWRKPVKVSCYVGKFDYNLFSYYYFFFTKGFPLNNQMGSCISSQSRAEKQFSKGWSAVPTRKVINHNQSFAHGVFNVIRKFRNIFEKPSVEYVVRLDCVCSDAALRMYVELRHQDSFKN